MIPAERPMTSDSFLNVAWRRRWTVLATMLVLGAVTYAYTSTREKVYETSATLLIAQPRGSQTFDAVQASQVAARTYGDVVTSANIAEMVSRALGGSPSPNDLEDGIVAEPVAETQLLKLRISASDPEQAKRIADTYAEVFTAYVRQELTPVTQTTITVADAASVPRQAAKPKPKLFTALALIFGLGLGLALAALRERFDHRLRTVEDLERALGDLPVLARVPRRGRGDADGSAFVEAFRVLRANLQFAHADGPLRTIAVTSLQPTEGKSTTVSQLGQASATAGRRVVVVEADLRRPSQQAFFRPDVSGALTPGLTTFIVGGATLDACLHATSVPALELMPAGPQVPSLAGLLESARGREVLGELADAGDLVLFDCPPLSVGADAGTVSGSVDGVILVVDMERSTLTGVREALRQLRGVRASVLGVVVNRDPQAGGGSYGYGDAPAPAPARQRVNL